MRYFLLIAVLGLASCTDYEEIKCNTVVEHTASSGDWQDYLVKTQRPREYFSVRTKTVFVVGDCIKLTKSTP